MELRQGDEGDGGNDQHEDGSEDESGINPAI
jgi:hypothetical protein